MYEEEKRCRDEIRGNQTFISECLFEKRRKLRKKFKMLKFLIEGSNDNNIMDNNARYSDYFNNILNVVK